MQILPEKRERHGAQIAIVQKEQNFILVSMILEDKIREVKELFWSHAAQKLRAELALSIQRRRGAGVCRVDGDKGRQAGDLVLMLLFWVSLALNLALLWGLSYPNCSRDGGNTKLLKVILFFFLIFIYLFVFGCTWIFVAARGLSL